MSRANHLAEKVIIGMIVALAVGTLGSAIFRAAATSKPSLQASPVRVVGTSSAIIVKSSTVAPNAAEGIAPNAVLASHSELSTTSIPSQNVAAIIPASGQLPGRGGVQTPQQAVGPPITAPDVAGPAPIAAPAASSFVSVSTDPPESIPVTRGQSCGLPYAPGRLHKLVPQIAICL